MKDHCKTGLRNWKTGVWSWKINYYREGLEVYRRGHACLQSKIKMKILTTLSAPWQLDFPHPCFCLLIPPGSSFYTPHPQTSSLRHGVSKSSSSSHGFYKLCSDPSWPSSSPICGFMQRWTALLPPSPCTFPTYSLWKSALVKRIC